MKTKSKSARSQKRSYLPIVAVVLLGLFAFLTYQLYTKNQELKALEDQDKQRAASETITLPPNAVKLSGCIPYMGEHWAVPEDIPFGPQYLVHNNKVIGIEYMFKPEQVPGEQVAKASPEFLMKYMQDNKLSLGDLTMPHFTFNLDKLKYTFASFEWTQPHAGLISPHYDIHFYLIDRSEVDKVCPDATVQQAQTPEIEKELEKYNIPYFPMPKN